MNITRRRFLQGTASTFLLNTSFFRAAFAAGTTSQDILVFIMLRGGWDGLNVVFPWEGSDRAILEAERPKIKIPVTGANAGLRLEGINFGLHPAAHPFYELYQAGKLAFVHAVGLNSDTRSHFDAQFYIESGIPNRRNTPTGWLGRYLASQQAASEINAVSLGSLTPASLNGYANAFSTIDPNWFVLSGRRENQYLQRHALRRMYGYDSWLDQYGQQTLNAIDLLEGTLTTYTPAGDLVYPNTEIGRRLQQLAQLIKADLGLTVAALDMGGWDTHRFQDSRLKGQLDQLSQAVSVFYRDLSDSRVTVVIMSEFGRRLKENSNDGSDHGHGGLMIVLGNQVNGGQVYGQWPGLARDNLYDRADLAVTTDFRLVLSEVLIQQFGVTDIAPIFPDYVPGNLLGLMKST